MTQQAQVREETILDALGNPVRRHILRILAAGPQPVGDIAATLPVSRPAVSKHLRLLERAELVTHEGRGNRNVFRLNPSGFAAARTWLESFWDTALSRFADLTETTRETEEG